MGLFDPDRHEPINDDRWDPAAVRRCVDEIASDVRAVASPAGLWPNHPQDVPEGSPPMTMLYLGAAGVIWGLDFLAREGAIEAGPTFAEHLPEIGRSNHEMLSASGANTRSYLMGDAGVLLARWRAGEEVLDEIAAVISANTDQKVRELMWGAPGTMLLALEVHRRTGDPRFADLFNAGADALEATFDFDSRCRAHAWTQEIAGQARRFLGAVHGFAGNAYVLIRGRHLLSPASWSKWSERFAETLLRTAIHGEKGANWPVEISEDQGTLLVQHCHGAPGMVTCLAELPEAIENLLIGAGDLIWAAGPLRKGANLCHGTAGNGYAFLKLFERTGDECWLDRARAFAMHAIAQSDRDAGNLGRRRYSLWTGDVGLAIYLWDCLLARAHFPTLDIL